MTATRVITDQIGKTLDEYEQVMHPLFEWAYEGNMTGERFALFIQYAEIMRQMILLREGIQKQEESEVPPF